MSEIDEKTVEDLGRLNDNLSTILAARTPSPIDASERRLERLEARLDKIWDENSEAKKQIAILEERISHLPTKPDLWKGLSALFAGFLTIIIFAEKLQSLVK